MTETKHPRRIARRDVLKGAGALGLATATAPLMPKPAIAQKITFTASVWGGVTQDGIKAHVQPEFEKMTGATMAYDIGGQGARYNKLMAQRASPVSDVFFASEEAIISGMRAGIVMPANKSKLPNFEQIYDWAYTIKMPDASTVGCVPFTLITYQLAYNPEIVKEKPTSWADMWRPEFKDKLALAAPVHALMPAFVIVAAELAGGGVDNVDPGFKKLAELRPSKLTVFWTDWAAMNKTGDVTLATEFDYYLETMKEQKYPIEYVIPKEKGLGLPESVGLVKGTKNQELGEAFMNLMMSAKVQEAFAKEMYAGPINKTVKLEPAVASRVGYGPRVEQMRFFDPVLFADKRPQWTERINTEVVPNWRAR